jgi:hypothetical protein
MRLVGFLLLPLAALTLASCAATPSSAPPPPAQAPTSEQPASPTAAPPQSQPPSLAPDQAYGAELSTEAKSRLNLSKEYAQQVISHLQAARNTANTEYACDELIKSFKAAQATVSAADPARDEIERKRGKDAYSSLTRQSISTQDEIRKLFNMRCKAYGAAVPLAPPPATSTQSQPPFVSSEEMALSPSRSAIEQRDREANEFREMKANIEATAKQFVVDRRLLEARQKQQLLDQQIRIRQADMVVVEQQQKLLELQAQCRRIGC